MSLTPAEREQLLASRSALHRNRPGLDGDLHFGQAAAAEIRRILPEVDPETAGRVLNIASSIAGTVAGDMAGRVPTVLLIAALDLLGPELGPPVG